MSVTPVECSQCGKPSLVGWVRARSLLCESCVRSSAGFAPSWVNSYKMVFAPISDGIGGWVQDHELTFGDVRRYLDACLDHEGTADTPMPASHSLGTFVELLSLLEQLKQQGLAAKADGSDAQQETACILAVRDHSIRRLRARLQDWRPQGGEKQSRNSMPSGEITLRTFLMEVLASNVQVEYLKWILLEPKGDALGIILKFMEAQAAKNREVLEITRLRAIFSLVRPVSLGIGQAEFHGYVAFIPSQGESVVLESAHYGNALYLMPKDLWRELSQFSKSELIYPGVPGVKRLEHRRHWFQHLRAML